MKKKTYLPPEIEITWLDDELMMDITGSAHGQEAEGEWGAKSSRRTEFYSDFEDELEEVEIEDGYKAYNVEW